MNIFLSPFAPENLVSRDGFGSPVPPQPAHLHTQAESGAYLRDSSRVPRRRPFIYVKPPYVIGSVPSLFYRATQLRTDGVHCRESAGTGPVNLKVVPNECCQFAGHHGPIDTYRCGCKATTEFEKDKRYTVIGITRYRLGRTKVGLQLSSMVLRAGCWDDCSQR